MMRGVLSSPWLRLYKVVGEIPGESDLISVVITAPAPASRLTQHSQPRPGPAVIIDLYLTGQVQCGALSQLQEPGHVLAGPRWLAVNLKIVEMYSVPPSLPPPYFNISRNLQTFSLRDLLESSRPWTDVSN